MLAQRVAMKVDVVIVILGNTAYPNLHFGSNVSQYLEIRNVF